MRPADSQWCTDGNTSQEHLAINLLIPLFLGCGCGATERYGQGTGRQRARHTRPAVRAWGWVGWWIECTWSGRSIECTWSGRSVSTSVLCLPLPLTISSQGLALLAHASDTHWTHARHTPDTHQRHTRQTPDRRQQDCLTAAIQNYKAPIYTCKIWGEERKIDSRSKAGATARSRATQDVGLGERASQD